MTAPLLLCKTKGKVADLEEKVAYDYERNHWYWSYKMGYTCKWCKFTPTFSNSGDLVIIHNGIIENYAPLKEELIKRGYVFHSDTDTEVLVNLIEEIKNKKEQN
jgi:glucosamine--fructose-6-phosphate aminotransferase (isomerizing)